MATTCKLWHDAGATNPVETLDEIVHQLASDGSSGAVDKVVYLGSAGGSGYHRAESNPGVDNIVLSLVDNNAGAGGVVTHYKLALSQGGLAGATAGAPLVVGAQIARGVTGLVPIYIRATVTSFPAGDYTDVVIASNNIIDEPA